MAPAFDNPRSACTRQAVDGNGMSAEVVDNTNKSIPSGATPARAITRRAAWVPKVAAD